MHKNRRAPGSRPVLCIYLYSGGTSPDSLPVSYRHRTVLPGLRRKPDVSVPSPSGLLICLSGQCSPLSPASPGTVHGCLDGRAVCKDRKHTPYTGSGLYSLCYDWSAACVWGDAESAWVWGVEALMRFPFPRLTVCLICILLLLPHIPVLSVSPSNAGLSGAEPYHTEPVFLCI